MLSDRSYRRATSVDEAIGELQRMAGHQFDPVIVTALESFLRREGTHPAQSLDRVELVA